MRAITILKTAYLNLRSGRMRSILTIGGVIIGIGSIIFLVSLGYGLERLVTSEVTDFEAFSQIDVPSASAKTLSIDDALIERIQQIPHVLQVGHITTLAGRARDTAADQSTEVISMAIDKPYWAMLGQPVTDGRVLQEPTDLIINESLLNILAADGSNPLGRQISLDLIVPRELTASGMVDEISDLPFQISGVVAEGTTPFVYFSSDLLPGHGLAKYSSLKVKADDRENISIVRTQLENLGLATEYVGDTVKQITQAFSFFRIILGAFGFIALVVASLGTFNVLTIALIERTREIGLMKALGMQKRDVYWLFVSESLLISFFGGLIGLLGGILLGHAGNSLLAYMARLNNVEPVQIFNAPLNFTLLCGLFSLIIGLATGWFPARRAFKMNAIDALRYE